MRKCLVLAALAALLSPSVASAQFHSKPPYTYSYLYPCYNTGWQSATWWYPWGYPWYAYYNFSHGPYANWMAGGGWATVDCGPGGCGVGASWGHASAPCEATLAITLPADAKLLFNGLVATGSGETRTFRTPPLQVGQSYSYELTAEVVRDGKVQTTTEKVVVRPGERTTVTLSIAGTQTASK